MQNDLMTAGDLQRALVTEIEEILKDLISTKADGTQTSGFKGYEQFLPVLVNDDETADQFFPYFIVRLADGVTKDDEDLWTITADILLGLHDDDVANNGHRVMLNAITRITTRFAKEATLGYAGHKAFRCSPEMEWGLQDEDTYPYFFGGVELKFFAPKPQRREPDYGYC